MKIKSKYVTILGLFIFGLGTFFVSHYGTTNVVLLVLGVILILSGSYVTYVANKVDNDTNHKVLLDRIDKFEEELHTAQNSPQQIEEIADDYNEWAKQVKNANPEIALALEKEKINDSEKLIKFNNSWNSFFQKSYNDVIKLVEAINKEMPENKLIIHNINNGSSEVQNVKLYSLVVEFTPKTFMNVFFGPADIFREAIEPRINFGIDDNLLIAKTTYLLSNVLSLHVQEDGTFKIRTNKKFKKFTNIFSSGESKLSKENFTDFLKNVMHFALVMSKS